MAMVIRHLSQIVKITCAVMLLYLVIICKGNILRKICNDKLQIDNGNMMRIKKVINVGHIYVSWIIKLTYPAMFLLIK